MPLSMDECTKSLTHELRFCLQGSHRSGNSGKSGKILKTFSSQGNQGKTGVFQPKSGKKISDQGTFFQIIFKPFKPLNLRKIFFKTIKPQELLGNCT